MGEAKAGKQSEVISAKQLWGSSYGGPCLQTLKRCLEIKLDTQTFGQTYVGRGPYGYKRSQFSAYERPKAATH